MATQQPCLAGALSRLRPARGYRRRVNTRFRSSEIADILGRSGARLLVLWPDFRHIDFLTILTEADPFALDRLEGIVICGSAASQELVKGKRMIPYDALNQHSRYTGDRGDGPLGSVSSPLQARPRHRSSCCTITTASSSMPALWRLASAMTRPKRFFCRRFRFAASSASARPWRRLSRAR